jgi:hypothetical protein
MSFRSAHGNSFRYDDSLETGGWLGSVYLPRGLFKNDYAAHCWIEVSWDPNQGEKNPRMGDVSFLRRLPDATDSPPLTETA